MPNALYAHTRQGGERHGLIEHLEETARLAGRFASEFDTEGWGYLAGLWHDLGKSSEAFQSSLTASSGAGDGAHESEI
jgi:CRISPR-associated endonuclease/helicase Cas3